MRGRAANGRSFFASNLVTTHASSPSQSDAVSCRARLNAGAETTSSGRPAGNRRPRRRSEPGGWVSQPIPASYDLAPAFPVPPNRAGSNRGRWSAPPPPPNFFCEHDPRKVGPGCRRRIMVKSQRALPMIPDNSLDFAFSGVQHTPMRLLIIEDDRDAAEYLVKAFREVGHVADWSADGEDGLAMASDGAYDVLVVDRMLPKRDGLSVISALRAQKLETPVLILSALGQVDDRVKGLRAGGDDYLPKPYSFAELLARIEVLARRRGGRGEETSYRVADLELDRLSHSVRRGTTEIDLQPREFRLLEYLMKHAGQVVTRTMLLENVWDYHFDPQTNVIDVHISRLRSKIDKGFAQPLLHTVRGAGYMIRDGARLARSLDCVP